MSRYLTLLLLLGVVAGCRDEQAPPDQQRQSSAPGQTVAGAAGAVDESGEEINALIERLDSTKYAERVEAALRLGKSGSPEAVGPLLAALDRECALSDAQVAARNMTGPGPDTVVASGYLKGAYQMALCQLGPQVREPVLARLPAASEELHPWLRIVLGYLGDQGQLEPLMGYVRENPDGFVREAAARALGHVGSPEAVPALRAALDDPFTVQMGDARVPLVREAARAALKELGAQER